MNYLVFIKTKFNSSWTVIEVDVFNCWITDDFVFDRNLKSHVVCKVTCNRRSSIYVGQTSQELESRRIKRKKSLKENALLNVVLQRIVINGNF